MLKISGPLVSVNWLHKHLNEPDLVILDASMKKVTANDDATKDQKTEQIKNARFLDIKLKFSDTGSRFPNTMLSPQQFSEVAQEIGINNNSAIVVYDTIGIYSSPRVWWMFKAMGHENIAVLDGGGPEWKEAGFPCEEVKEYTGKHGDFKATYQQGLMNNYHDVLAVIDDEYISVVDARSENRFKGIEAEPREGLRSGHIPNSINLPYSELMENHTMKKRKALRSIFNKVTDKNEKLIFTCGSGITACILALGADIAGIEDKAVYDGSWTEWGTVSNL